jgi:hypothetical protein
LSGFICVIPALTLTYLLTFLFAPALNVKPKPTPPPPPPVFFFSMWMMMSYPIQELLRLLRNPNPCLFFLYVDDAPTITGAFVTFAAGRHTAELSAVVTYYMKFHCRHTYSLKLSCILCRN